MKAKQILSKVVKALFTSREDEFSCGDCLRNAQCGAEPSPHCVVRAAQIASDRRRPPRRETFIGW